ncbi:hypothetical protein PWY87_19595 [Kribbella solani]|uniref:hypothetical protein n=1 Tax=Kribbella solani TaxID=236067 RepID=UPI0029B004C3|nr:hypothetical protein [Kribbella solani]MDX2968172.1 hypothetical protein [Kribbella solani]MDX3003903.1 hypothetical protein [Kribbella solani]
MSRPTTAQPKRRVRVWLGEHKVIDHTSEPAAAARFEELMRHQHRTLRITNDPAETEQ